MSNFFNHLHRAGVVPLVARFSRSARRTILQNVHYNTDWIMNQMAAVDLLTDSLMQRPLKSGRSGLGRMDASSLALPETFKKYFGYRYALPLSQGRLCEFVLCRALLKPGAIVPNNGLFISTRLHQLNQGGSLEEMAVRDADLPESDFPFKANFDLEKLKIFLGSHAKEKCAYLYAETSANGSGGHPISMENLKAVHALAKEYGVPFFLDACRIMENAFLIREREKGYSQRSLQSIVQEMCSYSDGCTMSATKDFPVDTGAFIATNREDWFMKFQEIAFLVGDGLSVRSKASLNDALEAVFRDESRVLRRARQSRRLWEGLRSKGVPLVAPYSAYAVFLDARGLSPLEPPRSHSLKAFLAQLYLDSGILACENMITDRQKALGLPMIRLTIPCTGISQNDLDYCVKNIALTWKKKEKIPVLKKIAGADSPAGELLARYELDPVR